MTYEQVIDLMNGKTFYSKTFGEENVTVFNRLEVVGESGLLNLLSCKQDIHDLYSDYKKTI